MIACQVTNCAEIDAGDKSLYQYGKVRQFFQILSLILPIFLDLDAPSLVAHFPENLFNFKNSISVSCLVTTVVMLGLVAIIVIDGFFVHTVYRTFHFFAYQEDKAKENRNNQTLSTSL
ncbi:unnamed protein product [Strongylus vulgaris]|uniref:Uncharacterized protein n=1 Tax=Strongylus vulgaris TaxID=40348 RepID=A0A3P7JLN5_STRVU|nr:unnamed protein product [Strongylus vulgaris]